MQQVEGFGDTYMPAVQAPSFGASGAIFCKPRSLGGCHSNLTWWADRSSAVRIFFYNWL